MRPPFCLLCPAVVCGLTACELLGFMTPPPRTSSTQQAPEAMATAQTEDQCCSVVGCPFAADVTERRRSFGRGTRQPECAAHAMAMRARDDEALAEWSEVSVTVRPWGVEARDARVVPLCTLRSVQALLLFVHSLWPGKTPPYYAYFHHGEKRKKINLSRQESLGEFLTAGPKEQTSIDLRLWYKDSESPPSSPTRDISAGE